MRKALYYPYIEIPEGNWLSQAVLYWDELGCIVPYSYINDPNQFSPHMREYTNEGLIQQISPAGYMYGDRRYKERFLEYIDNKELIKEKARQIKDGYQVQYTMIHMEKLGELGTELVRRNLAWKGSGEWFLVETITAECFMTYLASLIGSIENYEPLTRKDVLFYKGFRNYSNRKINKIAEIQKKQFHNELELEYNKVYKLKEFGAIREHILDNLLPVPDGIIKAKEIMKFKEKNGKSLNSFRNYIEDFIYSLDSTCEELKDKRMKDFLYESKQQQEEVEAKMKEFGWWKINKYELCMLLTEGIGISLGYSIENKATVILGSVGLALSVANNISNNIEVKKEFLQKPLAYSVTLNKTMQK